MENPAQYIPMDDTTRLIIIAGLLIPFIINTITEAFMQNKTARTVIQCIVTVPAWVAYVALLGFWLQNNMPGSFVLILLVVGGLAIYVFAYHFAAEALRNCLPQSNYAGQSGASVDNDLRLHPAPQTDPVSPVQPPEKTLVELFDEAVIHSNEDEAIIYGSDLLQEGELIHVMLGFKKLADKGFSQSRDLYVNLVYRLSCAQRRSQSYATWEMTLNELNYALGTIETADDENAKDNQIKLKREQMCWNAVAKVKTTEGEYAEKAYHTVALKLLGELTVNAANDPDAQECIAFVNTMGITLTSSPKPAVPRNPPVKPSLPQTLKNCLRCGTALSGEKCNMCNLDHTKDPIRLLVKVDSRDLQISK